MKIELIKIEEDRRKIIYKISQENFIINNKIFKINKQVSNLSRYLKSINIYIMDILNSSIENNKCINCSSDINRNRFERNKFITYKFCEKCDIEKIRKKYDVVNCIQCNKEILYKDVKYSTCGDDKCLNEYRLIINNKIKETHWVLSEDKEKIMKEKTIKRKENDKKLNRVYIAWNKGKTGIYSKETIEKIRNATINQMKNGRIKKTGIEKLFENFLKENNIKYTYSFIYKKRQFDFLIPDFKIIIEIQGDYWHANPMFWDIDNNDSSKKKLYETQIMKIKDDKIKKRLIEDSEYQFISFWEYDIHNNFDKVTKTLFNLINIK